MQPQPISPPSEKSPKVWVKQYSSRRRGKTRHLCVGGPFDGHILYMPADTCTAWFSTATWNVGRYEGNYWREKPV